MPYRHRPGGCLKHKENVAWVRAAVVVALLAFQVSGRHALPHKSESSASLPSKYANRVLLGSHNRVLWLDLGNGRTRVLAEGRGVYHGIISGDPDPSMRKPRAIWVLSRPHNWRASSSTETLLKLSALTGFQLDKVEVPAKFAHDLQRVENRVYVVSTGDGCILELDFPSMQLRQHLEHKFTLRDHVNTIAPSGDGHLWVMKHNMGESAIVKMNSGGKVLASFPKVGRKAHGLGRWREFLVVLDSESGALNLVHNTTGAVSQVFKLQDEKVFLKGLAILGDRAIFGINQQAPRSARADPKLDAEVAVLDLRAAQLLSRIKVATHGLLNVLVSPEAWRSEARRSLPAIQKSSTDSKSPRR